MSPTTNSTRSRISRKPSSPIVEPVQNLDRKTPLQQLFRQNRADVASAADQQYLTHRYRPLTVHTSPNESGGMRTSSGSARL